MIPKPRSHFVKVECDSCKNIKVLYTFGTKPISCPSCNAELLVNTGGQAKDVQETISFILPEMPEGSADKTFKHADGFAAAATNTVPAT